MTEAMRSADTFPKLLLDHARKRGNRPALREKGYGIWQTWAWSQVAAEVRALACGLAAMGFKRGQSLAIIGDNRIRLYQAMAAAQSLGGVPVPLFQDAGHEEMVFVLNNADVHFAVAEDQEQVDRLCDIRDRCPHLAHIIYADPRGISRCAEDFLHSYEEVQGRGRVHDEQHPEFYPQEVAQGRGEDVAFILYTSGTTGGPKGVVLTHDNLIISGRNAAELDGLGPDEEVLAYLPMAWAGDNMFSFAQSYVVGFCVSCPESSDTVLTDIREIGPTYFFAPPRIFENILTTVMIRMEYAGRLRRSMFHYFIGIGRRVGIPILEKKPVRPIDRLLYGLARWCVFKPLMDTLGFSRIRVAYTAGDAIGPDIFNFYRSLGMNLKQVYGQTEGSVFVTIQHNGEIKDHTVGTPAKDVEIRISEAGEVLYRGPGVFHSYAKDPEATRAVKDADGWVHTGDAGCFNGDGHLTIIDRVSDLGRLNDGTPFAPKYIENKLKFSPYVKEAVAFGDQRDCVAVIINIDPLAVGNWAQGRNLWYSGYADLAGKDEVYELIAECVAKVNRELAGETRLGVPQISRFLVLHKELDADDGELTRTRKVRRHFIAEKYAPLIDALYAGKERCHAETQVKFEDGRVGVVRAELGIREVQTFVAEPSGTVG